MIKNVRLKRILTNTLFRGFSVVNRWVRKRDDMVLLYSNMGFRDNVAYIYDYMIEQGYHSKYRMIRCQNEKFSGELPPNVKVIGNVRGILSYFRAGHVFYAFGKLPIYPSKGQKVVQMWHGSPFKGWDRTQEQEMTGNYKKSFYTDCLVTSECFSEIYAKMFDCGLERISVCGQPRTDVMANPYPDDELKGKGNKLILWMPTFRKSKKLGYNDVEEDGAGLLPVVRKGELASLNEVLRQNNVKLMVKLHPMQDLDEYKKSEHSNISILSHQDFLESHLELYRLLGSADALITDYSSVFYDFMLMDRPIAFTVDDFEEYKDHRGFAVKDPDYYRTGPKLKDYEDVAAFVRSVSAGQDEWRERRGKVNEEVNVYRDFENRRRALEIGGVSM